MVTNVVKEKSPLKFKSMDEFVSWAIDCTMRNRGSVVEDIIKRKIDKLFKKGDISQVQIDTFRKAVSNS